VVGWCTAEIFAEIEWLDGAPPRYSTRLSLSQFGAVSATPEILAEIIAPLVWGGARDARDTRRDDHRDQNGLSTDGRHPR
jgi:hypothetical protein